MRYIRRRTILLLPLLIILLGDGFGQSSEKLKRIGSVVAHDRFSSLFYSSSSKRVDTFIVRLKHVKNGSPFVLVEVRRWAEGSQSEEVALPTFGVYQMILVRSSDCDAQWDELEYIPTGSSLEKRVPRFNWAENETERPSSVEVLKCYVLDSSKPQD